VHEPRFIAYDPAFRFVYTLMYVFTYVCVYIWTYVCICIHTITIYTHLFIHVHLYIHICTLHLAVSNSSTYPLYTCTYTYIIHPYIYTYKNIYIHSCIPSLPHALVVQYPALPPWLHILLQVLQVYMCVRVYF